MALMTKEDRIAANMKGLKIDYTFKATPQAVGPEVVRLERLQDDYSEWKRVYNTFDAFDGKGHKATHEQFVREIAEAQKAVK